MKDPLEAALGLLLAVCALVFVGVTGDASSGVLHAASVILPVAAWLLFLRARYSIRLRGAVPSMDARDVAAAFAALVVAIVLLAALLSRSSRTATTWFLVATGASLLGHLVLVGVRHWRSGDFRGVDAAPSRGR